jgi:hypothetical protein
MIRAMWKPIDRTVDGEGNDSEPDAAQSEAVEPDRERPTTRPPPRKTVAPDAPEAPDVGRKMAG